jgi:hypothetical protein
MSKLKVQMKSKVQISKSPPSPERLPTVRILWQAGLRASRLCQKGERLSPPFGKGRLGGIFQSDFKQLN